MITADLIPAEVNVELALIAVLNADNVVTPVMLVALITIASPVSNVGLCTLPVAVGQLDAHAVVPTSTHVPAAVSVRYFFKYNFNKVVVATIAYCPIVPKLANGTPLLNNAESVITVTF